MKGVACKDNILAICLPIYSLSSYMKAARLGDVLEVKAECQKVGKTLAFASVDIVKKDDGAIIAQGRQTKLIGTPQSS